MSLYEIEIDDALLTKDGKRYKPAGFVQPTISDWTVPVLNPNWRQP